jgi:predicted RecA/RadA family phage recombinase
VTHLSKEAKSSSKGITTAIIGVSSTLMVVGQVLGGKILIVASTSTNAGAGSTESKSPIFWAFPKALP